MLLLSSSGCLDLKEPVDGNTERNRCSPCTPEEARGGVCRAERESGRCVHGEGHRNRARDVGDVDAFLVSESCCMRPKPSRHPTEVFQAISSLVSAGAWHQRLAHSIFRLRTGDFYLLPRSCHLAVPPDQQQFNSICASLMVRVGGKR